MYNLAITEINLRFHNRCDELYLESHCLNKKCDERTRIGEFMCDKHIKDKIPWNLGISLQSIRKAVMKSNKELKGTLDEWQCETPYDTRQLSIKEAITAYRSAVTNKIRGNINNFQLGYKLKRDPSQIFCVDSRAINILEDKKISLFPSIFKKSNLRINKRDIHKLPDQINHDIKILRDGGTYYLLIPVENKKEKVIPKYDIIGNDQGIRTFTTTYSPDGLVMKFGEKQKSKIDKITKRIDILNSKKKNGNIRKRIRKLYKKIRDIVSDLHNQICSIQTNNYKRIILPIFNTSEMKEGNISRKTKRDMDLFSFYKFKQKLRLMCNRKGNELFIECDERNSTMVCTNCLRVNEVGSQKIIKCVHCGVIIDRDIAGSRNIVLKHLTY